MQFTEEIHMNIRPKVRDINSTYNVPYETLEKSVIGKYVLKDIFKHIDKNLNRTLIKDKKLSLKISQLNREEEITKANYSERVLTVEKGNVDNTVKNTIPFDEFKACEKRAKDFFTVREFNLFITKCIKKMIDNGFCQVTGYPEFNHHYDTLRQAFQNRIYTNYEQFENTEIKRNNDDFDDYRINVECLRPAFTYLFNKAGSEVTDPKKNMFDEACKLIYGLLKISKDRSLVTSSTLWEIIKEAGEMEGNREKDPKYRMHLYNAFENEREYAPEILPTYEQDILDEINK